MEQVATHNTPDDLWIVINGDVYDVTDYKDEHPGGADLIEEEAGTDATEIFEDIGHSDDALELLANYKIGTLKD